MEHEEGLAMFIEPAHRARFRDSMRSERLRRKLRAELPHFRWLDPRFAREVRSDELAGLLRERGAPATCFVLGEHEELDGVTALEEALDLLVGGDHAALISCVPGRLAVHVGEAPEPITLLERPG